MTQTEFNRQAADAALPFVKRLKPLFPDATLFLDPHRLFLATSRPRHARAVIVYYGRDQRTGDFYMDMVLPANAACGSLPAKKWQRDCLAIAARLSRKSVAREVAAALMGYHGVFRSLLVEFKFYGKGARPEADRGA